MMRISLLVVALAELASVSAIRTDLGTSANLSLGLRDDDGGYHYMPQEKALICICAKCGSTSLYSFIYKQVFNRTWNYTGIPYIHDVVSPRWEDKFQVLKHKRAAEVVNDPEVFKFALMRDPKERIMSAWKSKAACDGSGDWGTDRQDRDRMVPNLLRLANMTSNNSKCLGFEKFLKAVAIVHRRGLQSKLNNHFRPQQEICFRDFRPVKWSKVASIRDADAAHLLGAHLGHPEVTDFPQFHSSSSSGRMLLTAKGQKLLNEITRKEYAVLNTRNVVLF